MRKFPPGPGQFQTYHEGGPHIFAALCVLLLLAAVIIGVVLLVRSFRRPPVVAGALGAPAPGVAAAAAADPALAEVRLRYARGDITRDDYVQRAIDLGDRTLTAPVAASPTPPA